MWHEDFEIEVDGCKELIALVLNSVDGGKTDLLVAKGNLVLSNVKDLVRGGKQKCLIHMTGDIKLEISIKYTK